MQCCWFVFAAEGTRGFLFSLRYWLCLFRLEYLLFLIDREVVRNKLDIFDFAQGDVGWLYTAQQQSTRFLDEMFCLLENVAVEFLFDASKLRPSFHVVSLFWTGYSMFYSSVGGRSCFFCPPQKRSSDR